MQGWCPSEVPPPWQQHQSPVQQVQQVPKQRKGTGAECREVAFVKCFSYFGYLARGPDILVFPPTVKQTHFSKQTDILFFFKKVFDTGSLQDSMGPNS